MFGRPHDYFDASFETQFVRGVGHFLPDLFNLCIYGNVEKTTRLLDVVCGQS